MPKLPDVREKSKKDTYFEAVGRRKEATARVRIFESSKKTNTFVINDDTELGDYFPTEHLITMAKEALHLEDVELPTTFLVSAHLEGGGYSSQAEAMRLGIARALVAFDKELRKPLKKAGYLRRDPRAKERKKPGKKKARKSSQWSKR